ncbi:hypothetical protein MNB_SV-6-1853 [hydrothermal vent metagenome]|uniref:Sulfur carrier protein ThiS n=1 Tax=hydrothermal vent metagenome TaxID=652676 RepID=A0A1W1C3Y9_9ZZZZ
MIIVTVNGESRELPDNTTLLSLMSTLNIKVKIMAAAINMEVVKKSDWDSRVLVDGDRVELLHFVGGG